MDINLLKLNDKLDAFETFVLPFNSKGLPSVFKKLYPNQANDIYHFVSSLQKPEEIGKFHILTSEGKQIILVGFGENNPNYKEFKKIITALSQALKYIKSEKVLNFILHSKIEGLNALELISHYMQILNHTEYKFEYLKSNKKEHKKLSDNLVIPIGLNLSACNKALNLGKSVSDGVTMMRDLANMPANICTPEYLANEAKKIAQENKKFSFRAYGLKELTKMKMGGILSVTQGSKRDPRFIVLEYNGAAKSKKPIVFCGKGITFDTGGISLKPAPSMDEMKFDMSGAASVIGLCKALAVLDAKVNFVAIIPACENMPSGTATRPGDVVTTYSGKTVEVLNTDAEGRMILCDALTYAQEKYDPLAIIDIATLTGACVIALGHLHTGLFSNDLKLINKIKKASKLSHDSVWHMPSDEEYGDTMATHYADFANIGTGRAAGASLAAQFLSRFIDNVPWAHLDIAGTAYGSGQNKISSGRPVPLLIQILLDQ
jgi:leucyl aminopeptidase